MIHLAKYPWAVGMNVYVIGSVTNKAFGIVVPT